MKGGIYIQFGKFGISDPVLSVASNHSAVALRSAKKLDRIRDSWQHWSIPS